MSADGKRMRTTPRNGALRARVLGWLAANPEGTVEDIARDVIARTADVRDELRKLIDEGLAVAASRGTDPRAMRRVYLSPAASSDGLGRASGNLSGALVVLSARPEPTHCDQILSLLSDGTVWSSHELHRRVFCILHSRIADLRKKLRPLGFDIEHTGGGAGTDEHFYRLICVTPLSEPSAAGSWGRNGADGSLSGVVTVPPENAALHSDDEQLQLEAA